VLRVLIVVFGSIAILIPPGPVEIAVGDYIMKVFSFSKSCKF
jgi:hypothetical protein